MKSKPLVASVALILVMTFLSCSNALQLTYQKPPTAGAMKGPLYLKVDDARPADKGGDKPLTVGIVRSGFGIPYDIMAASHREPAIVAKEMISECLMSAGYQVVSDPSVPHMSAQLTSFWSDGYVHNRIVMKMPLDLKKSADTAPAWTYDLDVNTGFTPMGAGFSQFNRGYNQMLNEAKDKLLEQFKSTEFEGQYRKLR
jgi:hypothetical protein